MRFFRKSPLTKNAVTKSGVKFKKPRRGQMFWQRNVSRASFGNSRRLLHLRFRGIPPKSSPNEETDTEHMHKLRVRVLNAKTPLPGAEFKIWPLKSAPEVTYLRNNFFSFVSALPRQI